MAIQNKATTNRFLTALAAVIAGNGYPLDSSDHYMLWLVCLVLVRHDDLAVGNGINRHGLLDKSIEQLAPVP
jgi:hypothetical protein